MQLKNRSLWLIGASSGIGAALVPALTAEGARLAISARRVELLERVADTAYPPAPRPLVKPLDATRQEDIERVYAELVAEWGRVDVLFYNAGVASQGNLSQFDTADAVHQIDVNYMGLVRAVGAVLPAMIERRSGNIVGMASLAGYAGLPTAPAYSSSKAAAIAFLQALRIELHGHGIGVTTINPGFVETPLVGRQGYTTPFMITPEATAAEITKGLLAGDAELHFPKRLSWPAKLVTGLPRPIYEFLARLGMRRMTW